MEWFYLLSLFPVIVGAVYWVITKEIIWKEWVVGSLAAFAVAGTSHFIAFYTATTDIETFSGEVIQSTHFPQWVERYTETSTETVVDSDGSTSTETKTEVKYRTHPEYWEANASFGAFEDAKEISENEHMEYAKAFDGEQEQRKYKSGFYSGNPNIYVAVKSKSDLVFPVHIQRKWVNRLKGNKTLFNFVEVPKNIPVFEWPQSSNWRQSNRVLGNAQQWIPVQEWDKLNSQLGARHRVNLICVGFPSGSEQSLGQWQQAKWQGGKQNDLVIVTGGGSKTEPADWAYVFGWSETKDFKRTLESELLSQPLGETINLIKLHFENHPYIKKDWKKFDYISITPPTWSYFLFFAMMVITQGGLYIYFHKN